MSNEPLKPRGGVLGGLAGFIFVLWTLLYVLPVLMPYLVAIALLVIALRLVWFFTNHW